MSELLVIQLDRADVFVAAMDRLHLAVTPQLVCNLWCRDTQRKHYEEDQHNHAKQHEPLLVTLVDVLL
jgi:hypothetical protein